jgi:hypothetical protein
MHKEFWGKGSLLEKEHWKNKKERRGSSISDLKENDVKTEDRW